MMFQDMRLQHWSVSNVGPIKQAEIDFDALGGGTVAVGGSTGSGKSHSLALMGPGIIWRTMPYYDKVPNVYDHLENGAGWAQAVYEIDGMDWTFRIEGDGKRSRRFYVKADGVNIGPLQSAGDALLAERKMMSLELMLATIFTAQGGGGGLFNVKEADRRARIIEMLHMERFDAYAKAAGERHRAAAKAAVDIETSLAALQARIAERDALLAQRAQQEAMLAEMLTQEHPLTTAVTTAQSVLDVARARQSEVRAQHVSVQEQIAPLAAQLAALDAQITTAEQATVAAVERIDVTALQEQLTTVQAALDAAEAEHRRAQVEQEAVAIEYDKANGLLIASTAELEQRRQALIAMEAEAKAVQSQLKAQEPQLQALIAGLGGVDLTNPMCMACPLTEEGRQANVRLEAIRTEARGKLDAISVRMSALVDLMLTGQQAAELAAERQAVLQEGMTQVAANVKDRAAYLQEQQAMSRNLSDSIQAALAQAERAQQAAQAASELADLAGRRQALREQQQALLEKQGGLAPVPSIAAEEAALREAQVAERAWRETTDHVRHTIANLNGQLSRLDDPAEAIAAATMDAARQRLRDGDFTAMQTAWEQVRWAEIDAACPAIEAEANDLLLGFQSGRFRIALPTSTALKSGKGEQDGLVPRIIDTWQNTERVQVSGGETGMCDEALRAGLSIYNTARSGYAWRTAFRDEPTSALDAETSTHYGLMLRQLLTRAKLYQLIFVSHSQQAYDSADHLLWVENGTVRVKR